MSKISQQAEITEDELLDYFPPQEQKCLFLKQYNNIKSYLRIHEKRSVTCANLTIILPPNPDQHGQYQSLQVPVNHARHRYPLPHHSPFQLTCSVPCLPLHNTLVNQDLVHHHHLVWSTLESISLRLHEEINLDSVSRLISLLYPTSPLPPLHNILQLINCLLTPQTLRTQTCHPTQPYRHCLHGKISELLTKTPQGVHLNQCSLSMIYKEDLCQFPLLPDSQHPSSVPRQIT